MLLTACEEQNKMKVAASTVIRLIVAFTLSYVPAALLSTLHVSLNPPNSSSYTVLLSAY